MVIIRWQIYYQLQPNDFRAWFAFVVIILAQLWLFKVGGCVCVCGGRGGGGSWEWNQQTPGKLTFAKNES